MKGPRFRPCWLSYGSDGAGSFSSLLQGFLLLCCVRCCSPQRFSSHPTTWLISLAAACWDRPAGFPLIITKSNLFFMLYSHLFVVSRFLSSKCVYSIFNQVNHTLSSLSFVFTPACYDRDHIHCFFFPVPTFWPQMWVLQKKNMMSAHASLNTQDFFTLSFLVFSSFQVMFSVLSMINNCFQQN